MASTHRQVRVSKSADVQNLSVTLLDELRELCNPPENIGPTMTTEEMMNTLRLSFGGMRRFLQRNQSAIRRISVADSGFRRKRYSVADVLAARKKEIKNQEQLCQRKR